MTLGGVEGVLPAWADESVVRVVAAAAVLAAGWYLARLVVRLSGRRVARRFQRPSVTRTVLRGLRLGLLLVTVFAAMAVWG
jgi:hypothetical protein